MFRTILSLDNGVVVLGATGGYLLGFVIASGVVGRLAELGWDRHMAGALGAMAIGNVIIYVFGIPWLMVAIGMNLQTALDNGSGAVRDHGPDQARARRGRVPAGVVGRRPTSGRALTTKRGDPGVFGPASEAWRLDREAMLLLGAGPRALLLQIAHPAVAAGVAEHSNFREDPWQRLHGTIRSYLTIVYGSTPAARAEVRRLNELHSGITGSGYSARDPELSLWVHATLIESTIAAYDAWLEPLSRERRARFYDETKPVGRAFGIPNRLLPADIDAFDSYYAAMLAPEGPVHPTPVARDLARTILRPPLAPLAKLAPPDVVYAVRPVLERIPIETYSWAMWPSVGLLPAGVREEYGLRWGPLERAVSAWLVAGWQAWRPLIPTDWRWMPHARAADRRVAERQET